MDRFKATVNKLVTRYPLLRELGVLLVFCALTSILSWPYVTRLRDAVVDPGDPYLVSWVLWWDYHQTFADPLRLFHSNVFYPYRYTLAFTEHCYGIALLFFPLFLLGFRPLTVHAVAIFFGFVTCGYGAFRLARTLTGSSGVAWVAGIIFAFGPFRFHYMSHLPYLFSAWIPLLLEALVLFIRDRSRKQAVWLGIAFFLTGLSTISWFLLSLLPLTLSGLVLVTRYRLWRDRQFWLRGSIALAIAGLALLPFMMPYFIISRLYGFRRSVEEVKAHSALPIHWLSAEDRNKFWHGLGAGIPDGWRFKLFPGLLPIVLSLVALVSPDKSAEITFPQRSLSENKWIPRLDLMILVATILSVFAIGFDRTDFWFGTFKFITSERALTLLLVLVVARLCIAYPEVLRRGGNRNLVETIYSKRYSDTLLIGIVLVLVGFCCSLGWNSFVYRIQYDLLPPFRSMRVATRGSMIAYLGLSLLAGLGSSRIAELGGRLQRRVPAYAFYWVVCILLSAEFNAAPLHFFRGEIFPDAVTERLKHTTMRGGIVYLPAGPEFNHRYILRAADHAKPLIVGTSGFNPPYEDQIEILTRNGAITDQFIELLEHIPASYLVIEDDLVPSERRAAYNTMLTRATASGRLRFINRFDGHSALYAVTKTEPEAQADIPSTPTISANKDSGGATAP